MGVSDTILLIGVGNEYRSDDGLGIFAVRELRRRCLPDVVTVEHDGEGTGLIEAWERYDRVIIIDALFSGAGSGDIHRFDVALESLPAHFFRASSHAIGVTEAVELARVLHKLPRHLLLFGIEGKQFEPGSGLSDAVLKSMPDLLCAVQCELVSLRESGKEESTSADSAVV